MLSLILCYNIKSFTFKKIDRSWQLSLKKSLYCFFILERCNVVSLTFSFFFSVVEHVKLKNSRYFEFFFSLSYIKSNISIYRVEYFNLINSIASFLLSNWKRIIFVESCTVVLLTYNIACKCWNHSLNLSLVDFESAFTISWCFRFIISLIIK